MLIPRWTGRGIDIYIYIHIYMSRENECLSSCATTELTPEPSRRPAGLSKVRETTCGLYVVHVILVSILKWYGSWTGRHSSSSSISDTGWTEAHFSFCES